MSSVLMAVLALISPTCYCDGVETKSMSGGRLAVAETEMSAESERDP